MGVCKVSSQGLRSLQWKAPFTLFAFSNLWRLNRMERVDLAKANQ